MVLPESANDEERKGLSSANYADRGRVAARLNSGGAAGKWMAEAVASGAEESARRNMSASMFASRASPYVGTAYSYAAPNRKPCSTSV